MLVRLLTAFFLVLAAVESACAGSAARLETELQQALELLRARYAFPGATVAVVAPDGRVTATAVGLADIENARDMGPDTMLLAASIGKTFVAAAVLALESEGHLARSDRLSDYFDGQSWFSGLPNASDITLDQLLHHTAGLPDHVYLPAFRQAWSTLAAVDHDVAATDLVAFLAGEAPLFAAGTAWSYSDTGYVLLGLVIEAVTGNPWQEAVQDRFLEPFGLNATVPAGRHGLPELAVGYVGSDNTFGLPRRTADVHGRLLWNPAVEAAGGGFASTAGDLARWGHVLFTGGAMSAPYLNRLLDGVVMDDSSPDSCYGAGVAIHRSTPRGTVYGHAGWAPGYVASLRHYADYGVTIAFQVNSDIGFVDNSDNRLQAMEAVLVSAALKHIAPGTVPGDRPGDVQTKEPLEMLLR
jgi:D-alanyl-D-alanine carboxypeptidase